MFFSFEETRRANHRNRKKSSEKSWYVVIRLELILEFDRKFLLLIRALNNPYNLCGSQLENG